MSLGLLNSQKFCLHYCSEMSTLVKKTSRSTCLEYYAHSETHLSAITGKGVPIEDTIQSEDIKVDDNMATINHKR